MKKGIALLLLTISFSMTQKAFAVWPPSTSLEKDAVSEKGANDAHKRLDVVVQKLEKDERRLAALLDALEKDQKALTTRPSTSERDDQQDDRKKK